MSSANENPKRRWIWRPRFSIRTLAILMSLVCAYFAAWGPTQKYGVPQLEKMHLAIFAKYDDIPTVRMSAYVESPLPLVISQTETVVVNQQLTSRKTKYRLWLFGPMIPLPFEWNW